MKDTSVMFSREMKILSMLLDSGLTFTNHVKILWTKAVQQLSSIRRASSLLKSSSIIGLYSSQVLPVMEYYPLIWNGCPLKYLQKLDSVRDRAQRLIDWKRVFKVSLIAM